MREKKSEFEINSEFHGEKTGIPAFGKTDEDIGKLCAEKSLEFWGLNFRLLIP